MKGEKLQVYGHPRRFYLASALATGLAMVAGGSPSVAQPVDPDAIAGNSETVSQLSALDTTVAGTSFNSIHMVHVLSDPVSEL